jgi:hypothetical protein
MPTKNRHIYQIELDFVHSISEERVRYEAITEDSSPLYDEIESADRLRDAQEVAADLGAIDWSFTADETGFLTHDLHPYPAKFIPQIPVWR